MGVGVKVVFWLISLAIPALVIFNLISHNIPLGLSYFLLGILCTLPAIALSTIFTRKQFRVILMALGIATSLVANSVILGYMIYSI